MQFSFTITTFCIALVAAAPKRASAHVASNYDNTYSPKPEYPSPVVAPPQSYGPVSDNYGNMPTAPNYDNGNYSEGRGSAGYPPYEDNRGSPGPSQPGSGRRSGQSPDQGHRSGQPSSQPGSGQRSGHPSAHKGNRGGNYPGYPDNNYNGQGGNY